MLNRLFLDIYSYDGINWTFLVTLITFILFPIVLFLSIKCIVGYRRDHKKSHILKLLLIQIVFLPIFWQVIPATLTTIGIAYPDLYNLAIKTSMFKTQKGAIYLMVAKKNFVDKKNITKAIESTELAYNYLGDYYADDWTFVALDYFGMGEFDQTIKIAEEKQMSLLLADCYILKGDYKKALEVVNKGINKRNIISSLEKRSYINRVLGNLKAAENDQKTAQNLCKNSKNCNSDGFTSLYKGDYRANRLADIRQRRLELGLD